MRHRQHDVADVLRCRPLDRHLHQRDQTLRSLEREALGAEKPLLDELLEDRRGRHLPVDPQLLLTVDLDAVFTPLHPHLQPLPHPQVVHVHELHADRPAVGVAEPLDDLPQRHRLRPLDRVGGEGPVHVLFGEVVELRIEFGQPRTRPAERIDLRHQVAANTVGPHELINAVLQKCDPLLTPGARRHRRQREWHRLAGGSIGQLRTAVGNREGVAGGDAVGRDEFLRRRMAVRMPIRRGRQPRRGRHCNGNGSDSEPLEVGPPVGINAVWIRLVLLEKLLEKCEAAGPCQINVAGRAGAVRSAHYLALGTSITSTAGVGPGSRDTR